MKLILEIRTLLKRQGIGAIFVSHSKEEAFAFADRLALFRAGHIEQVGEPEQLYRQPQNRFVAEFLGGVNYLAAEVVDSHCVQTALGVICGHEPHGRAPGERLQLMLRPQQLALAAAADGDLLVREQQFLGHHCRVLVECAGQVLEASIGEPLEGERARVTVAPHTLVLFEQMP
jgi:iron(III) transport system ATP-binding protein